MNESVSIGGRQTPGFALGAPAWQFAAAGAGIAQIPGVVSMAAGGGAPSWGQIVFPAVGGALLGLGVWWVVERA